jgi:hypothetical protein
MKTLLSCLLIAAALAGCGDNASQAAEAPDIYAAVFRYQIGHNLSSQRDSLELACLATVVNGVSGDPAPAVLARFGRGAILVRRLSECTVASFGVFDNASGKRGIELKLGKITWLSSNEVKIEGGYYEASESGSGNTYRLRKTGRQWEVVDDQLNWVS